MPRIRETSPLFFDASLPDAEHWQEEKSPEQRIPARTREILEKSGHRTFEESEGLLQERLASTQRRKARGEGRLSSARTIDELKAEPSEKKVLDGALAYLPIENDAVIINASDAHGNFADLSVAIKTFIERKARGEKVYFNFSGDISSGDTDNIVPAMEALSSLQARFPNEVTIETGNGDRRGTSLLLGYSREIAMRFAPELHQLLENAAEQKVQEYANEQKLEDAAQAAPVKKIAYGAELARLARLAGAKPSTATDFNREYLAGLIKGMTGGRKSQILSEMVGGLGKQIEPLRAWEQQEAQAQNQEVLRQARRIYEYWQLADKVMNEQPALAVYRSPDAAVLATHSGFAAGGKTLTEVAYSPKVYDQATWNKLIHTDKGEKPGDTEKYGAFRSFDPIEQGRILENILPKNQPAVLVVGHNHGNFTERLPLSWGEALRVENCVSSHKKRAGEQAAYVEIDVGKLAGSKTTPEDAIAFKKISPEKHD